MPPSAHHELGAWASRVSSHLATQILPDETAAPETVKTFVEEVLARFPLGASQVQHARRTILTCLLQHQGAREPARWQTHWQQEGTKVSVEESESTKIVSAARLSSKRPEERALFLKLQALVEPTLKEVWSIIQREGTLESAAASAVFASKVGSAIAGIEDGGVHALWEDVIKEELPTADVLLIFGVAGFVLVSRAFLAEWIMREISTDRCSLALMCPFMR